MAAPREHRFRHGRREPPSAARGAVLLVGALLFPPAQGTAQQTPPETPPGPAAGEKTGKSEPVAPPSPEVRKLLDAWAKSLSGLRTLHVRFKQTKHLRVLRRARISAGETWLQGRRLVMRITDAKGARETELRVAAGQVEIHYPRLGRLEIYPARGAAGARAPFPMVVEDVDELPRRNRLRLETDGDDQILVMTPRDPKAPMAEVRMRFRAQRLRGVEQRDRRGNRVALEIVAWKVNPEVPAGALELVIPPETKVVRIGGKPKTEKSRKSEKTERNRSDPMPEAR